MVAKSASPASAKRVFRSPARRGKRGFRAAGRAARPRAGGVLDCLDHITGAAGGGGAGVGRTRGGGENVHGGRGGGGPPVSDPPPGGSRPPLATRWPPHLF